MDHEGPSKILHFNPLQEKSLLMLIVDQPGVAILHCTYAIYHLSHRPTSRTPASSSSYFFFSLFLSISLLPFFVYTCLLANVQLRTDPLPPQPWNSVFPDKPYSTDTLIFALFILAICNAGLHFISSAMCLYLGLVFRTISKMPPDMNPLEDNLTSRHHKKKVSDLSFISNEDKHRLSTATTASVSSFAGPTDAKRMSQHSLNQPMSSSRSVPFMQTRAMNPTESLPRGHASPRYSRSNLPSQVPSPISLSRATPPRSPTKRNTYAVEHTPPTQHHSNARQSLLRDNWYSEEQDENDIAHQRLDRQVRDRADSGATRSVSGVSEMKEHEILLAEGYSQRDIEHLIRDRRAGNSPTQRYNETLHPLSANPPTPPPAERYPNTTTTRPQSHPVSPTKPLPDPPSQTTIASTSTGRTETSTASSIPPIRVPAHPAPLSTISNNLPSSIQSYSPSRLHQHQHHETGTYPRESFSDNLPNDGDDRPPSAASSRPSFKARFYGDLKCATPPIVVERLSSTAGTATATGTRNGRASNGGYVGGIGLSGSRGSFMGHTERQSYTPASSTMGTFERGYPSLPPSPGKRGGSGYEYTELSLADDGDEVSTPPPQAILTRTTGTEERSKERVLSSSGAHFGPFGSGPGPRRREVSGKIVEEGRGGNGGEGERMLGARGWW